MPEVKLITNKEDLKAHIHAIHNYMRNNGVGYGFDALNTFNLIYGLKLLEDLIKKKKLDNILTKDEKKSLLFSELVKLAESGNGKELYEKIDETVCTILHKHIELKEVFFYEIPKDLRYDVIEGIVSMINQIDTESNHHLAGKVYEYFIGRDETAISSLGAYYTDRLITKFIIEKFVKCGITMLNNDGTIKSFCDPFGGSGGFTLTYIDFVIKLAEKQKLRINWENDIKKINHYDLSNNVIKMAKLEIFTLTHTFADRDKVKKINSFTHGFNNLFDIILSNPPYGGDKNEKTPELKDNEKLINHIHEILPEYYNDIGIEWNSKTKLSSKSHISLIEKVKSKTDDEEVEEKCDLILGLIEQLEEIKEKNALIEKEQKEKCVNFNTCGNDSIIQNFIVKYKNLYTEKYKSGLKTKDKRYIDYNFGDGSGTQYANDKEACSLILLMALLEKGGTCGAVLKEGVFFDSKYSFLREILIEHFKVTHVVSIPNDQFENTTTKTTYIMFTNPKNEKDTTNIVEFGELKVTKEEKDVYEIINNKVLITKRKDEVSSVDEVLLVKVKKEDIAKPTVIIKKNKKGEIVKEINNYNYYLNWKNYEGIGKEIYCPEDFRLVKLGDILNYKQKSKRKASDGKSEGKYRFYTSSEKIKYCNECDYDELCIIFGNGGNGSLFLDTQFSCSDHNFVCVTKDKDTTIYVYNYIKSIWGEFVKKLFNGSTLANISLENLNNYQIPFPKDIIKIKPQITKLYDTHNKINDLKEEFVLKETQIQQKIREICDENECDAYKLGDVCEYIKTGKNKTPDDKKGTLYPYYGTLEITGYTDHYIFEGKHILTARNGSKLHENCFLVDGKFYPSDHVFAIKNNDKVKLDYLYYSLLSQSDVIEHVSNGSTVKGITKTNLENLIIKIPKDKKVMKKLEELIKQIDELNNTLKDNEQKYKNLLSEFNKLFEQKEDKNPNKKEKIDKIVKKEESESEEDKKPKKKEKIKKIVKDEESESEEDEKSKKKDAKKDIKKIVKKEEFDSDSDNLFSSDDDEFIWDISVVMKMKKYKDDKDKLKELMTKNKIPKDIFNEKVKELQKKK